ncbi:hypothetical protein [Phyllobacterium sp. YR531]|uniref:hypothetical protein n=1 Tax=Phyllobacterium sp. YR531 TaxID=1144343 RepID=UPI00026FBA7D|nr:hypothetical protein [Phyllobacterium sp. YR531]EJN05847.1 hypothetical protein PMI41_00638 [Phyllobacterium sp. YR531]
MKHKSAMWQTYQYQGHEVVIIQQWQDPFGKSMVRIAANLDGGLIADGMLEEKFLSEAIFLGQMTLEIVEGAN